MTHVRGSQAFAGCGNYSKLGAFRGVKALGSYRGYCMGIVYYIALAHGYVLPLASASAIDTLVIIHECVLLVIPQDFFHSYSFSLVKYQVARRLRR